VDQRIIYQRDDGGVSIIVPSDCGLTIEEIAEKDVPTGTPYTIVDVASIPTDRTFRNAWTSSGGAIETDFTKAQDIAHEMRRTARSAEFAPLDIDVTIPDRSVKAEAERVAVRAKYDAMQIAIDGATGIDELLATVVRSIP